jgi:hypothetical protein
LVLLVNRNEFLLGAAALALAPDALARQLGGTPTALVTADLEAHVVALDLTTGRRLREIRTVAGPRSIERVGNDAVVAHTDEGGLSIVDGATLRVRRVLGGFREPRYVAAARDGRHAFVTESARGALAVVDVNAGRVVSRIPLGGPARHLSTDESGFLWTSLGNTAERVAVVDVRGRRPRLLRRFAPPFLAHDVGLGPTRRWVTGGAGRRIALYDGDRRVALLPADAPPQHVTFVGSRAFVTSGDDGTLHVHDARTGRVLTRARIPIGSYNVQQDWGVVLMPSLIRGTLCVADARGRIVRTVAVARSSHDACFVMSA